MTIFKHLFPSPSHWSYFSSFSPLVLACLIFYKTNILRQNSGLQWIHTNAVFSITNGHPTCVPDPAWPGQPHRGLWVLPASFVRTRVGQDQATSSGQWTVRKSDPSHVQDKKMTSWGASLSPVCRPWETGVHTAGSCLADIPIPRLDPHPSQAMSE